VNKYFQVVYEDNHIIIVNKASGILVQGDSTGDITLGEMVKHYIKEKYNKPGDVFLGVIHRLDRPVSGLVAMARTSKGLERMNELFRKRDIYKTYWAIVKRKPPEKSGKLVHYLVKNEATNVTTAYDTQVPGSHRAELTYKVLGNLGEYWLIEVYPITGRPHQIRVQLASMGCPIRGDVKYGYSKANSDGSISLHARKLQFEHPIKKEPVICIAGIPDDTFWEQFLALDSGKVKDKDIDFLH
jgi:23S rRNA pseudouridine1911/1915/1917 synthase